MKRRLNRTEWWEVVQVHHDRPDTQVNDGSIWAKWLRVGAHTVLVRARDLLAELDPQTFLTSFFYARQGLTLTKEGFEVARPLDTA